MRTCSSCGEVYGEDVERCAVDGTALISWNQAKVVTRAIGSPEAKAAQAQAQASSQAVAAAAQEPDPDADLSPMAGRTLGGRYLLKRLLGTGGFGAVFEG